MLFDTSVSKQAQVVLLKQAKSVNPDPVFSNILVNQTRCQKYLGVYLVIELSFKLHVK